MALFPGSLPDCFTQAEPSSPPAGERIELFTPVKPGATPMPAAAALDLAALAARAPFTLYALNQPARVYPPVALRRATVVSGSGRTLEQFTVQYRQPAKLGGGIVVLTSEAAADGAPRRTDLDDSLDAARLLARLKPGGGNPLVDPVPALVALGCPSHTAVRATVAGQAVEADLLRWRGNATVTRLRLVLSSAQVTLETAGGVPDAAVALASTLVGLRQSPSVLQMLQKLFKSPVATPALPVRQG